MTGRALGVWAALALAGAGCGAPRPVWSVEAVDAAAPLVLAWHPARLMVEGSIDGVGPMLLTVDTGAPQSVLSRAVAERLGLAAVGDPSRARRVVAAQLAMGGVRVRGAVFATTDAPLGALYDRTVAAVVGRDLLAGRRLEYDRAAGVLRFPAHDAPAPPGAVTVRLTDDGRVPVEVAGAPLTLRLHSGAAASSLSPAAARAVDEAIGERRGEAALTVGGLRADAGAWQVDRDAPGDGVLGLSGLAGLSWRLDVARGELAVWRARPERRRFERFGPLPCTTDCVQITVDDIAPGRVTLRFEGAPRLPARYALRVDLGAPGQPFGALVQPGRAFAARVDGAGEGTADRAGGDEGEQRGGGGEAVVTLFDGAVGPETIRPVGAEVDVLDVVPVHQTCGGVVCLQRQEGDSTDSFVESSPPAGGSVDPGRGVAPAR